MMIVNGGPLLAAAQSRDQLIDMLSRPALIGELRPALLNGQSAKS
jgi:hypothetical protein